MHFFSLLWFKEAKKAKIMVLIMGILTTLFICHGLIMWGIDLYKQNNYASVTPIFGKFFVGNLWGGGVFIIVFLFYLINYLVVRKTEI